MAKNKAKTTAKKKVLDTSTELLVYTGDDPVRYMRLNGTFGRAKPGDGVMTPKCFIKCRLAEGEWKYPDSPEKEEEVIADGE